jgi:hypothetical protein
MWKLGVIFQPFLSIMGALIRGYRIDSDKKEVICLKKSCWLQGRLVMKFTNWFTLDLTPSIYLVIILNFLLPLHNRFKAPWYYFYRFAFFNNWTSENRAAVNT